MRIRRGRSLASLMSRLSPPDVEFPLRHQVKRPTLSSYRRNQGLTPEERIDSSCPRRIRFLPEGEARRCRPLNASVST